MSSYHQPEQLAASPNATRQQLYELAVTRPDLWPVLLSNPSIYPELEQWIRTEMRAYSFPLPQPAAGGSNAGGSPSERPKTGNPAVPDPATTTIRTGLPHATAPELQNAPPIWPQPHPQQSRNLPNPPNPGEPAEASQTKRSSRLIVGLVAGIAAAVLVIGGATAWLIHGGALGKGGALGEKELALLAAPNTAYTVALPENDANAKLSPIGPDHQVYLPYQDSFLVMAQNGDRRQVVAISTSSSTMEAAWVLPLSPEEKVCTVTGPTLDCGGQTTYFLSSQGPTPSDQPGSAGVPRGETVAAAQPISPSIPVDTEATRAVPYQLAGGNLVTKKGEVLAEGFGTEGRVWALPGPEGIIVLANGSRMIGLENDEVLWTQDLSAEAAEINGFDTDLPTWGRAGKVVLVGAPDGLTAHLVSTGEELWRVDVPVTSYWVTGDTLLVSSGDSISVLPLPGASDGEPASEVPVQAVEEPPLPQPDIDDSFTGELTVSSECAWRATGDEMEQAFSFTGGLAAGLGPNGESTIEIMQVQITTNDGVPYAVAWLECEPTGAAAAYEVAVYDLDLSLVQALPYYQGVSADVSRLTKIMGLEVSDEKMTVTSGPRMGYGDVFCLSCDGSYTASVDWAWNDGRYSVVSTTYNTPSGTVAEPNLDVLNRIFDEVANYRLDTVANYFVGDARETVNNLDACVAITCIATLQEVYFNPGDRVSGCALAPPAGNSVYFKDADRTLSNPVPTWSDSDTRPGDFLCLVDTTHPVIGSNGDAGVWWMVRPSANPDDFEIYAINRNFS